MRCNGCRRSGCGIPRRLSGGSTGAAAACGRGHDTRCWRRIERQPGRGTGVRLSIDVTAEMPVAGLDAQVQWHGDADTLRLRAYGAFGGCPGEPRTATCFCVTVDIFALISVACRSTRPTRRLVLWLAASPSAKPGRYRGSSRSPRAHIEDRMSVEILPAVLPPPPKPAGFYLDFAPIGCFSGRRGATVRAAGCDLEALASFGVTGNAPPLETPFADRESVLIPMSCRLLRNATAPGFLAYAPASACVSASVSRRAALAMGEAENLLRAHGSRHRFGALPDEPSNPGHADGGLAAFSAAFAGTRQARGSQPTSTVRGPATPASIRHSPHQSWLWPRSQPGGCAASPGAERLGLQHRLTSLERGVRPRTLGADRYLQWHARMRPPTRRPDDGREGDVKCSSRSRAVRACGYPHGSH